MMKFQKMETEGKQRRSVSNDVKCHVPGMNSLVPSRPQDEATLNELRNRPQEQLRGIPGDVLNFPTRSTTGICSQQV